MSEKTISIGFTNEEFSKIFDLAQIEGMSIAQYIKSKILSNEFNKKYKVLLQNLLQIETNRIFTVKELFKSDEWDNISRGVRLSLGKHFFKNVKNKNIKNVSIKGYGISGIMCYIKKKKA
jgi:hypothetical protein